jgi:hypothetical protein
MQFQPDAMICMLLHLPTTLVVRAVQQALRPKVKRPFYRRSKQLPQSFEFV